MTALRLTGSRLTARNHAIDDRDQHCCARCGVAIPEATLKSGRASHHHRKLKSRGGGDEVSNAVLLCGSGTTGCHGWAHGNVAAAEVDGWILHSWDDPRLVPVPHAIHGRVFLGDDGSVSKRKPRAVA